MHLQDCYEEDSAESNETKEERFTLQEFEELSVEIEHGIREIRKLVNHSVYLKINSSNGIGSTKCDRADFIRVSKDLVKMSDGCQKLSNQLNSLLNSLYN